MGAKNVCLMTDKNLSQLPPVQVVMDSLVKNGISFKVYDNVRVEPTDARYAYTAAVILGRSPHILLLLKPCPRPDLMPGQFVSGKKNMTWWFSFSLLQAS